MEEFFLTYVLIDPEHEHVVDEAFSKDDLMAAAQVYWAESQELGLKPGKLSIYEKRADLFP